MNVIYKSNNEFLNIINNILLPVNDVDLNQYDIVLKFLNSVNGNILWKLFEYYSCDLNNVIPWNLLPFHLKDTALSY